MYNRLSSIQEDSDWGFPSFAHQTWEGFPTVGEKLRADILKVPKKGDLIPPAWKIIEPSASVEIFKS